MSGPEDRLGLAEGGRLVLLRHGRTAWNDAGRMQGRTDVPLDATGRAQAADAAEPVAALGPRRLLSSPLSRALDTAAPLAEVAGLAVEQVDGLVEVGLGRWEGLTHAEARERHGEEYLAWMRGDDVRRGGGETYSEVASRALAGLGGAIRAGDGAGPQEGVVVAVTHGGTARAVVGALLGLEPESWWRLAPLGNCCWSVVVAGRRGWRLESHGVAGAGRVEFAA